MGQFNFQPELCNIVHKKDSRDYKLDQFSLKVNEYLPKTYEFPAVIPITDQGSTSMCYDFTCAAIEELQYIAKTGEYKEFAKGYRYGQKLFADSEGMVEMFEVSRYCKEGIPFAEDFNVVGTSAVCKAYFDAHITDELKAKAKEHMNRTYITVNNADELIKGMVNFGSPGYIGIDVHSNIKLNSQTNGIAPFPNSNRTGGHAMVALGVVELPGHELRYIKCMPHCGADWGDHGYMYVREDNPIIKTMRVFCDATPENEIIRLRLDDPVINTLKGDITLDQAPILNPRGDRTMVPLRGVVEALGFTVDWNPDKLEVTIKKEV